MERVDKYGVDVWANVVTDQIRRKECLCLNCDNMGNCIAASKMFELCKDHNLATMITRCPEWAEVQQGVEV